MQEEISITPPNKLPLSQIEIVSAFKELNKSNLITRKIDFSQNFSPKFSFSDDIQYDLKTF